MDKNSNLYLARKTYNRLSFMIFIILATIIVIPSLLISILFVISGFNFDIVRNDLIIISLSYLPLYFIAIPLGFLTIKEIPKDSHIKVKLSIVDFLVLLIMCFPIMYIGNIIGTLLSVFIFKNNNNVVQDFVMNMSIAKFVVIVIGAPISEELVFRKFIIDRASRFSEKSAIIFSALMFGLFHMNLTQFLYAFGIGLVWGYVYLRTRKIIYTMIMHGIVNFLGGVLPILLSKNSQNIQNPYAYNMSTFEIIYSVLILVLIITGIILLITKRKKFLILKAPNEIDKNDRFKVTYINVGFILTFILCISMIILQLIGININ